VVLASPAVGTIGQPAVTVNEDGLNSNETSGLEDRGNHILDNLIAKRTTIAITIDQ
jgi:hypothetical protein